VLLAKPLEDLRARSRVVAQRFRTDDSLEGTHHGGREAVRVRWERDGGMNAHHLPVAGHGVFAPADLGQAAPNSGRVRTGYDAFHGDDVAPAEPLKMRRLQAADRFGDVAERVGADVIRTIFVRVRQRARAAAVEDEEEKTAAVRGAHVRLFGGRGGLSFITMPVVRKPVPPR
jgi:hypothetical protein